VFVVNSEWIMGRRETLLAEEVSEAGAVVDSCRRVYDEALHRVGEAQAAGDPVRIAAAHLVLAEAEETLQEGTALRNRLLALTGRRTVRASTVRASWVWAKAR